MSVYPYLTESKPLYGPYLNYQEAIKTVRAMTREECELFVQFFWPHAFIYQHGREWTVLPLYWRDRKRLVEEAPEIAAKIPATLSLTFHVSGYKISDEETKTVEDKMWKAAAATIVERARTEELRRLQEAV